MSKVASFISLTLLTLERGRGQTFHRQLYEQIQQGILDGRLKPGTRLPSTRALATELGVSRNTVSRVFEQLGDEGYLASRVGSGARVTQSLPDQIVEVLAGPPTHMNGAETPAKLSKRGRAITQSAHASWQPNPHFWQPTKPKAFSPAVPALDAFPHKLWEKMLLAAWRDVEASALSYGSPLGYGPLREVLADYMQRARGVRCSPEQVIITGGTQQALGLIATLLLNEGDTVWVENPSFNGIHVTLQAALSHVVPVTVDQEGLKIREGVRKAPHARLVYISPSHQYPLGVTMSLTRRLELLGWAQASEAWIIEDDYDSEFRYEGYPLAALQGLDQSGRVIYLGTFSKVLFPALRLGYMVVPRALIEPLRAARVSADRGVNLLGQMTLQKFIEGNHFARHIRRMRTLYVKRQAHLLRGLQPVSHLVQARKHEAGLHLVGWLPKGVSDHALSETLAEHGIDAPALSSFALKPLKRGGLLLGYTAPEAELSKATALFCELIAKALG